MLLNNILPVLLPLIALSSAHPTSKACDYTCGKACYNEAAVADAQKAGFDLHEQGEAIGDNDYPHKYNNYEDFDFPVEPTYYEFPILSSGEVYDGGSPGADRVVFNENNKLAGLITHTGASGNDFVACT
ncbi:ribonuclease T1 complexed with 2gmp [Aspergillus campestris IBT 28561]|uniref:ribonuclease T1 n=1 Tax=Aspergillus campestris (strain IBT 28561) TaxID=1392248 RepID=A0A2I1D762_ASPC2|nr:ribonuclease T1 complexed with 2gmp [Aspergillus campestris IBT 28561]PKY05708.1 ribonuclease T1 complexed with 2gmp [Aspergillus campestris IBT 28561]